MWCPSVPQTCSTVGHILKAEKCFSFFKISIYALTKLINEYKKLKYIQNICILVWLVNFTRKKIKASKAVHCAPSSVKYCGFFALNYKWITTSATQSSSTVFKTKIKIQAIDIIHFWSITFCNKSCQKLNQKLFTLKQIRTKWNNYLLNEMWLKFAILHIYPK